MGVPRFYRWLSERYPRINQKLSTNVAASGNTAGNDFARLYGESSPEVVAKLSELQRGSSSSFTVDCLYLDLNGVIHNSTHANSEGGRLSIKDDRNETWLYLMNYIDSLVQIARPKRLLFLGVDGVAPRAKMNQQRSRRFRAAQDRYTSSQNDARFITERVPEIFNCPERTLADEISEFDSNCITPGTQFMDVLMEHLKFLIARQLSRNSAWKHLEVILSGPDVPGEGEHKIMEFIRTMRQQKDYPPNLTHCIQGLDADLIMLALMSHEPQFTLLREEVFLDRMPRWLTEQTRLICATPSFQLLHICLVREYLFLDIMSTLIADTNKQKKKKKGAKRNTGIAADDDLYFMELQGDKPVSKEVQAASYLFRRGCEGDGKAWFKSHFGFEIDRERIIDDFLLVCCLAGNDFLPHLSFADISKGGMDILLSVYQQHLMEWQLCSSERQPWLLEAGGVINWSNLLLYLRLCAAIEDDALAQLVADSSWLHRDSKANTRGAAVGGRKAKKSAEKNLDNLSEEQRRLIVIEGGPGVSAWFARNKELGTIEDYRAYHYWRKMHFDYSGGEARDLAEKDNLTRKYLEGLQWTMKYYFDGVPSWSWYYPYHYAPFTSHLVSFLESHPRFTPVFELGQPFKPFQQLMAVLPPLSCSLLPQIYHSLMLKKNSPILNYYPEVFDIDREGVKVSWGGVALLPFIDEKVLKKAMEDVEQKCQVTPEEARRNQVGQVSLYVNEGLLNEDGGLVQATLNKSPYSTRVTKQTLTRIDSSLPSYFPQIWNANVGIYTLPPDFEFSKLNGSLKIVHDSCLLPNFTPSASLPSLYDAGVSYSSLSRYILPSRVIEVCHVQSLVSVFHRVTRDRSLILKIQPPTTSLKELFEQTAKILKRLLIDNVGESSTALFDFSGLPSLKKDFPLHINGKLIGIWLRSGGYIPLHPNSIDIPCPLIDLSEYDEIDKRSNPRKDKIESALTSATFKADSAIADLIFSRVADNMYMRMARSGLMFPQERVKLDADEKRSYSSFIKAIEDFSRKNFSATSVSDFNWKDVLFEVVDYEEVGENLGSKPLLRFRTRQSHLVFWPQIEFLIPNGTVLTTTHLQSLAPSLNSVIRKGDAVLCTAESNLFGCLGEVVQDSEGGGVISSFMALDTLEARWAHQDRLSNILKFATPQHLRLQDIGAQCGINQACLRWLMKKVIIKVPGSDRGPVDIGLGLLREVRHPIRGVSVPVGIPGWVWVGRRHNDDLLFDWSVVELIQSVTEMVPRLIPSLMLAQKESRSVNISDVFPTRVEGYAIWCLTTFSRWLNKQPFRTIGSSLPNSEALPLTTIRLMEPLVSEKMKIEATALPQPRFVLGTGSIIRELMSPVTPVRSIKLMQVGQCVVTIKSGGPIAPGSYGVIIGLFPSNLCDLKNTTDLLAEVLLDRLSLGACDLGGRSSGVLNGVILPCRSLLPVPPILKQNPAFTCPTFEAFRNEARNAKDEFGPLDIPTDGDRFGALKSIRSRVALWKKP